jgi:hypothetical protein
MSLYSHIVVFGVLAGLLLMVPGRRAGAQSAASALDRLAALDSEIARASEQLERIQKVLLLGRALVIASPESADPAMLATAEASKAQLGATLAARRRQRALLLPAAQAEARDRIRELEDRLTQVEKLRTIGTTLTLLGAKIDPATRVAAEAERHQLRREITRLRWIAGPAN